MRNRVLRSAWGVAACGLVLVVARQAWMLGSGPKVQGAATKGRGPLVEATVLLEMPHRDVALPPSAVRLGVWHEDKRILLGGRLQDQGRRMLFKTPFTSVMSLFVQTEDFDVEGPDRGGYSCFWRPVGYEPGSPVWAAASAEPVFLGYVRVVRRGKVKVSLDQEGAVVATWPAAENAMLYVVCVSIYRGDGGRLPVPVLASTTREARFALLRPAFAGIIAARERRLLGLSSGSSMSAGGALTRVDYDLFFEVRAIGHSGRLVGVARSEKVPIRFAGRVELNPWREAQRQEPMN